MKVFIAVILCSATLALVDSCVPHIFCPRIQLALSDRRQYSCVQDSPSLDNDLYHIKFEERGATLRCRELEENDPDHDSRLQYPAAPEMIDNLETFAVAHVGGTQTAVCVNSKSTFNEMVVELAPKGYIVVSDMKREKNYGCAENTKMGGQISRGLSGSC